MESIFLEKFIVIIIMLQSGIVSAFAICYNVRFLTEVNPLHGATNYRTIKHYDPSLSGFLNAHIYATLLLSIAALIIMAYCVFTHASLLTFLFCSLTAFINMICLNRVARVIRAYMHFIDKEKSEQ